MNSKWSRWAVVMCVALSVFGVDGSAGAEETPTGIITFQLVDEATLDVFGGGIVSLRDVDNRDHGNLAGFPTTLPVGEYEAFASIGIYGDEIDPWGALV